MPPIPAGLSSSVITAAVPLIIIGNSLLFLLVPFMADLQYALPGFPDDPLGLKGADRAELAETGIRSIWPLGPGTELLREARLPEGGPAFTEFETSHMEDVRRLIRGILAAWLVAVVGAVVAFLSLRSRGRLGDGMKAAGRGVILGIALLAAVGLAMLVAYDFMFDGFHALFFPDGTWSFKDHYTLRRIYPDAFWVIATAAFLIVSVLQAIGLGLLVGRSRDTTVSSGPATP